MPDPWVVCCAAEVCCDDRNRAVKALATIIRDGAASLFPNDTESTPGSHLSHDEESNRVFEAMATIVLDNFQLIPRDWSDIRGMIRRGTNDEVGDSSGEDRMKGIVAGDTPQDLNLRVGK